MEIKTLADYGEIPKNSYVTAFINNSGFIILLVNHGTNINNAYRDSVLLAASSNFRVITRPKKYADFSRWLMDIMITQLVVDEHEEPEAEIMEIAQKYCLPGLMKAVRLDMVVLDV